VCEVLDEGERALLWFAHRVGAVQHPGPDVVPDPDVDPAPGDPAST
jgi:hypothetical protein